MNEQSIATTDPEERPSPLARLCTPMRSTIIAVFLLAVLLWGMATIPAQAQGGTTPRIVDGDGAPVAEATIRLLCWRADDATQAPLLDWLLETDGAGEIAHSLPAACRYVAALHQIHVQPAGKSARDAAYAVYRTSWAPGSMDLVAADGEVTVRDEWRLILFDVAVSLEWEPAPHSAYETQLRAGLHHASAYLYDLTDGQMAFGPVTIERDGRNWMSADVRLRAANDYRPSAHGGGIVGGRTEYTSPAGAETVYVPGLILLGRYWDGADAHDGDAGRWDRATAYRTLIHEWLHYALFLYDEYQDADADGRDEIYCTCVDLPQVGQQSSACDGVDASRAASAMAYHYTATELWLTGLPEPCEGTDQHFIHGESDWAALARWSAIQGNPVEWLQAPGSLQASIDLGLAGVLFGREPQPPGWYLHLPNVTKGAASPPLLHAREISLTVAISATVDEVERQALAPQIYLHKPGSGSDARIVAQGTTHGPRPEPNTLGTARLLDVDSGNALAVWIDRYGDADATRGRYAHASFTAVEDETVVAHEDPHALSLDLAPHVDEGIFRSISVTVRLDAAPSIDPGAVLCTPDAVQGCTTPTTMTSTDSLTWTAIFSATDGLPQYGVVWVDAHERGAIGRWYQAAGGVGPAHMFGEAPVRDGPVMVDAVDEAPGAENQVLIMPAADFDAVMAPLPPGVEGIAGHPWDVDVVLPDAQPLRTQRIGERQLPVPVVFTIFYSQAAVDRLGIAETQLQLIRFDRTSGHWHFVPSSGRSDVLNWLATVPVTQDGIYTVAWTPSEFGQTPQKYARRGPVQPGDPLPYTIAVPAAAANGDESQGSLFDPLPPQVIFAGNLRCNAGECGYDEAAHAVIWQGPLPPGALLILSFDTVVDPALTPSSCPPQIVNQAQLFDGQTESLLSAETDLICDGR